MSTFGEKIILHHNTKIGSDLIHSQAEYFRLFGHNKVAISFKFKPMSLLKVNEIDPPSGATIEATKSMKTRKQLEMQLQISVMSLVQSSFPLCSHKPLCLFKVHQPLMCTWKFYESQTYSILKTRLSTSLLRDQQIYALGGGTQRPH